MATQGRDPPNNFQLLEGASQGWLANSSNSRELQIKPHITYAEVLFRVRVSFQSRKIQYVQSEAQQAAVFTNTCSYRKIHKH